MRLICKHRLPKKPPGQRKRSRFLGVVSRSENGEYLPRKRANLPPWNSTTMLVFAR